jgi:hypothetical protein
VNEKAIKVKQEGDIIKNPALAQNLRIFARGGLYWSLLQYNGTLGDRFGIH